MGFFEKFKENKKVGILIVIVILLGLFLRFNDFGKESCHIDCQTYLPTSLLWFYPHEYYPGLSGQGEPALGHFFIGLGCLASGEDFSRVTEIKPNFYPGRGMLIGKELVNAEKYCTSSIYIFGLLFFITVIIFALSLLDIYSATYFISFFAFYPSILHDSRWINMNIFVYFFSILGLLFLWKAYTSPKAEKKELIFFVLSSMSFAAAFSSKLPAVAYAVFLMFILLEKYKDETLSILNTFLKNLNIHLLSKYEQTLNLRSLVKTGLTSVLAFASVTFVAFEFSFMNIYRVIQQYNSWYSGINTVSLNPKLLYDAFLTFVYSINSLDMLIFLFSFYVFIKVLFQKEKSKLKKFIIYQVFFLLFLTLIFKILSYLFQAFVIFFFGLILLMALTFSNEKYSITGLLKFTNKKSLFFIFMILYILFSFLTVLSGSPYFLSNSHNKLLCSLTKNEEWCPVYYYNDRVVAEFMASLLTENETFLPINRFYYIRREDHLIYYMFTQMFTKKFNREPNLEELVKYYRPMNRTLRYITVDPWEKSPSPLNLIPSYEPNYRMTIKGTDFMWVYDLQNLTKYNNNLQNKLPK